MGLEDLVYFIFHEGGCLIAWRGRYWSGEEWVEDKTKTYHYPWIVEAAEDYERMKHRLKK